MSDSLTQTSVQVVQIIAPVIIIVAVVSNLVNIAVFTRPALYHHACSRYLLALAANNLYLSSCGLTLALLADGYYINPLNYSVITCKILYYINTTSAFISPYLIVLASIDRSFATSTNVGIRRFSSVRVAKWMIFMIISLFSVFFINVLVLFDLHQERGLGCVLLTDTLYSQVYSITQFFLFAVVPPSLMILFGVMTIHNTKRVRVVPLAVSRFNRTEHQLVRMLFLQVSVHILLTLPTSVGYLMSTLSNTFRYSSTFSFIFTMLLWAHHCSYGTPFFLYLLFGRIYREELIRLLYRALRIRRDNRITRNRVLPSVRLNIIE